MTPKVESMVGFEIFLRVKPENRHEFLHTFKLMTRSEKRAGDCLGQMLFEDMGELNRLLWIEHWTDFESLDEYMKTNQFKSVMGAIHVLGELEYLRKIEFKLLAPSQR